MKIDLQPISLKKEKIHKSYKYYLELADQYLRFVDERDSYQEGIDEDSDLEDDIYEEIVPYYSDVILSKDSLKGIELEWVQEELL